MEHDLFKAKKAFINYLIKIWIKKKHKISDLKTNTY